MDIERSLPKAEDWLKTVLGAVAVVYAFGVVISNIFYADYGFADFGFLRPRYVMAGISFIAFAVLPLIVIALPRFLYLLAPELFARRWQAASLTIGLFAIGVYCAPMPLWSFIPFLSRADEASLFGELYFWTLYVFPTALVTVVTFWLACTVLIYRSVLHLGPRGVRLTRVVLVIGVLSLPIPFAKWVFPNIDQAAGGGQPELADLILKQPIPELGINAPRQTAALGGKIIPAILWHRAEDMYYISLMADGTERPSVIGIPSDAVTAIIFHSGYVRVETHNTGFLSITQNIHVYPYR
jgi:hypothetical protein